MPAHSHPHHSASSRAGDEHLGRRRLVSVASGMGISFIILLIISQAQRTPNEPTMERLPELRAVVMPPPPPPPPRVAPAPALTMPLSAQLSLTPTDSPVKFSYSPPNARDNPRPVAEPDIHFSIGDFKPAAPAAQFGLDHVFQESEVDEAPIPIFKARPSIAPELVENLSNPRVTMLAVVNVDGAVSDVRLMTTIDEQTDANMIEALQQWRFRPAMKDGQPVRCMIRQVFIFRTAAASRFRVD